MINESGIGAGPRVVILTLRVAALAAVICAISAVAWMSSASANSPIISYSVTPSTTQAGGHPNITIHEHNLTRRTQTLPQPNCACQDPKTVTFNLPTGLVGDPHAVPQCSQAEFGGFTKCPIDSQVGTTCAVISCGVPIFNLIPPPGDAGLLGIQVPLVNFPIYIVLSARTDSDYGLTAKVVGLTHIFPFEGFEQKPSLQLTALGFNLWGVPADPSNNPERWQPRGCDPGDVGGGTGGCVGGASSNAEVLPFLDNPTTCGEPLSASVEILSFDLGTSSAEASYPATTGCDQLSFNPSLFIQPTTQQADSASGSDVHLNVPQETSPSVPSGSEIRAQSVELPPGFTLTPNASDGKVACTDAEANLNTQEAAECPEFSKVGTLSIHSSVLPGPLPGFVYLGEPMPGNPYRLILVADGFGVHVKLLGSVVPSGQTGQLELSFPSLPQFPFEEFDLHFFGSERGLLATPTQCGVYPVNATFTPWDSALPKQHSTQYFALNSGPNGQPCPPAQRSFEPQFEAGVADSTAGLHSPFMLDLTRSDGDQNLSSLDVSTPPGFTATLAGVPYCSDAAIAAAANPNYSGLAQLSSPSCPAASQIGTSDVGTGAGTHPVYFSGRVYLSGPYKGAPLSLVVITPALSGPYDFGSIVLRTALKVDPTTAQVTAVSDPIPQIVAGVPLRLRSILVSLDRANFALNPTNCDLFSVGAKVFGDLGAESDLSTPFQTTDCTNLGFGPKVSLKLTGGVNRLGHPAIHALVTTRAGEANPSAISVTLPSNELLDNAHFQSVCTKVDFAAQNCPAGSLIGHAEVTSPLLDQPLSGNAYLRSSGRGLPDLALDLYGQFHFEAAARIDSVNGGLRTTFQAVPDVPLGSVALNLQGGSKGLIQNSEGLCSAHLSAAVSMHSQNGKAISRHVPLQPACGKKARNKRHRHSRAHRSQRVR